MMRKILCVAGVALAGSVYAAEPKSESYEGSGHFYGTKGEVGAYTATLDKEFNGDVVTVTNKWNVTATGQTGGETVKIVAGALGKISFYSKDDKLIGTGACKIEIAGVSYDRHQKADEDYDAKFCKFEYETEQGQSDGKVYFNPKTKKMLRSVCIRLPDGSGGSYVETYNQK